MKKGKKRKTKYFKSSVTTTIAIIIVVLICTGPTVILWRHKRHCNLEFPIDYNAFGTFGDFYGGLFGTIFLVISVFVVYRTYKEQIKQQIENRFFQLLKIHDSNVQNLKEKDPNIFYVYLREINVFVNIIEEYNKTQEKKWELIDTVKLAYLYFFYGVVEFNAERIQDINENLRSKISELNRNLEKRGVEYYYPAYLNLGIYFRQLYQTVTYIDGRDELNSEEKYELVKTLRVRLNIEEQYLLFLNSLTFLGQGWKEKTQDNSKNLITRYNLIKNIPKEFSGIEGIKFWNDKYGYPEVDYEFNIGRSGK